MKHFLTKLLILPTVLLFTVFSVTACLGNTTDNIIDTTSGNQTDAAAENQTSSAAAAITDVNTSYSSKDLNSSWDDASAVHITLAQDASTTDKEDSVVIEGNTITITAAGSYVLSGTLTQGQVIVDAGEKDDVQLVLQNVSIANTSTSPLYVKQADKTILTLATGSVNTVTDGSGYVFEEGEDEPDAAIFSKDDLTINGNGKLVVTGNYRNGIASKDDLVIVGGEIEVTAVNDGLRGRDSISVKDGKLTVTAGGDGLKSNQDADGTKGWICLDGGEYIITAENDGIQAETVLKINDGKFTITAGGGSENAVAKTPQNNGMGGRGGGMRQNIGNTPMDGGTPPDGSTRPNGGTPPNGSTRLNGGTPPDGSTRPNGGTPPDGSAQSNGGASSSNSTEAQAVETESMKGLKASSALIINGGIFTLNTNDDAVHSNGTLTVNGGTFAISAGDDGFHADADLVIHDGVMNITTSYEGLEGATVTINGGDIQLTASDDGINAAGGSDGTDSRDSFRQTGNYFVRITNGNLSIDAGGDGIDSNGKLYLDGGNVIVNGPSGGADSALDYDGECIVTGGTVIAVGAAGMVSLPSDASTQATLMLTYTESQPAESLIHITDSQGNTLVSFSPKRNYQSLIVSTPDLTQGETIALYSGDNKLSDITLSGVVTSVASDGSLTNNNMMRPGRQNGQGGR